MRRRTSNVAKIKIAPQKVKCLNCLHARLTQRRKNPIISHCRKRKDVDPVTFMMEEVREIAYLDRACDLYEEDPNEKVVEHTD